MPNTADAAGATIDLVVALKQSIDNSPAGNARAAIKAIVTAGERNAKAHARVQELEDERPLIKAKCIAEMIGTPNPLGKPGAVHSGSSAEAVVEEHGDYWQHRRTQSDAEVERHRAIAEFHAALLDAALEVEVYKASVRNV